MAPMAAWKPRQRGPRRSLYLSHASGMVSLHWDGTRGGSTCWSCGCGTNQQSIIKCENAMSQSQSICIQSNNTDIHALDQYHLCKFFLTLIGGVLSNV